MSRELIHLKRRIKKLVTIIESLDGFRSGYFTDIDRLMIMYKELGLGGRIRKWKDIRRDLERLVLSSIRTKEARKYLNYEKLVSKVYKIILILMTISLLSPLLGIPILTITLVIALSTIFPIILFTRLYIREKIRLIYISNQSRLKDEINRIREDISLLIQEVARLSRKVKLDPRSISMNLINIDYEGIEVVKRPGRFSRYYTVVPKVR